MNGVDYASSLSRKGEIYRKNLEDNNRAHKTEVERLKKAHESREVNQKEAHKNQIAKIEKSTNETLNRVKNDQKLALKESGKDYEHALNKYQQEFHEQRSENIKNWNKKFGELKSSFDKNIKERTEENEERTAQLKSNYDENVGEIRKSANKDLKAYLASHSKDKRESDLKFRMEKNKIIANNDKERSATLAKELEKRNFMEKNALRDIRDAREIADKRFLNTKDLQSVKFNKMKTDVDSKIQEQIIEREDKLISSQQEAIRKQNLGFRDRLDETKRQNSENLREIQYQKRAEDISRNEESRQIAKNFKENQEANLEKREKLLIDSRAKLEESYAQKLDETVKSYQGSIREHNMEAAEAKTKLQTKLIEENRKNKYDDAKQREEIQAEHQVSLKYAKAAGELKENDLRKNADLRVENLKASFNESLKSAQEDSQKNFEITQEAMRADKKELERRLHEQNSQQNAFLKEVHAEKLTKMQDGYEKKIQSLEIQNEMLLQNTNDTIRDVVRKTNFEIERQRKAAQESANSRVKAERAISKEKEIALETKLRNAEATFSKKMNEQTLAHRKKLKDVTFEANNKLTSEVNRYKDIIDQNNKFMTREIQRLKLASDTERQRLITQYEDRIQQLQKVYKEKTNELEQFNQLNRA